MRNLQRFAATVSIAVVWMVPASAQTTLVAGSGTAVLDGDISEWTSTPLMTGRNVELRAMADGEYLYLAATWPDATNNVNKGTWEYDGTNWTKGAGDEDRIMFIWDLGLSGTDRASCAAFCHPPVMRTNEGFVDLWHWKAARTNPVGFLDDTYMDIDDRHSDSGGKAYVDNTDGVLPTHMAITDPNASVDFLTIDAAALAAFDPFQALAAHTVAEAVTFNAAAGFTAGATIPFYLLQPATGDRGSVETAGRWDNGMWTVEFRKPYAAGADTTDFAVTPGAMIEFTHEIFDNVTSHGAHAFEPGGGVNQADQAVYTLDLSQIPAQTTLVAGSGTAVLDGDISEWTSTPLMTGRNVELRAMADGEYLYLAATWPDATNNVNKGTWEYDGTNWTKGAGDEDRIMFIWDLGLSGTDRASCAAFCHPPVMRTNEGFVDLWHWKAARTNPVGFLDDTYMDIDDRHSDSGGKAYVDNTDGVLPTHMAITDPNASVDFLTIDAAALAAFDPFQALAAHTVAEAVTFNAAAGFTAGATIPFYLLQPATGDRGSVETAGRWDNGMWTVEFRKPYAAGADTTDFAVTPGAMIEFTHEIFDNVTSHGAHAFEPGGGVNQADQAVYTLDLSQIPGGVGIESELEEVPVAFKLKQNYPNPFNPTTTIEFDVAVTTRVSLGVYNSLGKRVALLTDKDYAPGIHSVRFSSSSLPSGVYFYRLDAQDYSTTRPMVLLK